MYHLSKSYPSLICSLGCWPCRDDIQEESVRVFVNARLGLCVNAVTPMMPYVFTPTRTLLVYLLMLARKEIHFASQAEFVDEVAEVRVARPFGSVGGLVVVVLNEGAAELSPNRKAPFSVDAQKWVDKRVWFKCKSVKNPDASIRPLRCPRGSCPCQPANP